MQRRLNKNNQPASHLGSDLLDDEEQIKIVHQMQEQASRQQREIYVIFRYICIAASFLSLVASIHFHIRVTDNTDIIDEKEGISAVIRILHASVSGWLHNVTPRITDPSNSTKSYYWTVLGASIANICFTCIGLNLTTTGNDNVTNNGDHLHPALLLGNAIMLVVAYFIRYDALKSTNDVKALQESMYRFKSL
jgi:hypothetical protein